MFPAGQAAPLPPPTEPAVGSPEPPRRTRKLGRSRRYTAANLPARFDSSHAPRANRWEKLCMIAGQVTVQWLRADGTASELLRRHQQRWIAPGQRWRVADMGPGGAFELEVHADETVAAAAPQLLRAAVLDDLATLDVATPDALATALANLATGERRLLCTRFDPGSTLPRAVAASDGTLAWHPLTTGPQASAAVIMRHAAPVTLVDYLGRDHALIEAALAGALRGVPGRGRWLHNVLARHLVIEEQHLFPAYLAAGGREGWVRGLLKEHHKLRQDLPRLDDPVCRRRFLLLLDGHDEKEEQIVYPDIAATLAGAGRALTRTIMQQPLVSA